MPQNLAISTYPGQLSVPGGEFANFLWKIVPEWLSPAWLEAQRWRTFIQNQPLAVVARETLIANVVALDWKLVARDSNQQDELKDTIKYYTKLLENSSTYYSDLDFSSHVEWIAKDLLDLPFGGASEIGREGDDPNGDVLWIRPLDGGLLAPTLNRDYPVMMRAPEFLSSPIYFPYYSISRTYMSPRTEIKREGWGMAPPEKIYLAMELMYRGEKYYANLLLNTPEVGILDLGDMEEESAKRWIESFRDLMYGVNPFKVPVLYEHTTKTEWIPFGKLPNELMFDSITMRYASLIAAGYGMSISDLGFPTTGSGGETLAGTIRQERRTKRTGYSTLKKKLKAYFDNFIHPAIEIKWIDYDDELQVSLGRARLANANAWALLIQAGAFLPDEARLQTIQDGLVTISIPEKMPSETLLPGNVRETIRIQQGTNSLGSPQTPSMGGQGDTMAQQLIQRSQIDDSIDGLIEITQKSLDALNRKSEPVIHVYGPDIQYTPPSQQINITPTPVEIKNEIQVNPTPIEVTNEVNPTPVEVSVAAPNVDITNEVNPTPVEVNNSIPVPSVNVTNEVNPTPIEVKNEVQSPDVTVNLKQADKITSTVYRDSLGRISQVETENDSTVEGE